MKYIMLVLAMVMAPGLNSALAETFSCRDSRGALHMADNLMKLPEDCRDKVKTLDPKDHGKVNYVPATKNTNPSTRDFDRAVDEQQHRINARNREATKMVEKAQELANSYQAALVQRKSAQRRKKHGFRAKIIEADQKLQAAREGKELLLNKMKRARLSSAQKEQIDDYLARVED